jgi:3-hydroxyacyl-[acyl-carrier-protein] dehydratase
MKLENIPLHEVMKYLPHRYPFMLIDRVVEVIPGESLRAIKNVTINEPFFQGHFPQWPVMPGVLILEALAQAGGILGYLSREHRPDYKALYLLAGIDNARFRRQVEPGDQLILDVKVLRRRRDIWVYGGEASVGGKLAASAELMCAEKDVNAS